MRVHDRLYPHAALLELLDQVPLSLAAIELVELDTIAVTDVSGVRAREARVADTLAEPMTYQLWYISYGTRGTRRRYTCRAYGAHAFFLCRCRSMKRHRLLSHIEDHNCVDQSYVDRNYIGEKYTGHTYVGHN